ncbi:hypothetical protein GIB67_037597 [Kingdonia uniflora]|uniref:Uncharacterized protein n=1 Tax=Kingdonia uniflora TaxID=39325 RepID=A0A7J7LSR3_9MAGN|nr:hypothetical protein GIB67_037597 [Kingdonia uniflora]
MSLFCDYLGLSCIMTLDICTCWALLADALRIYLFSTSFGGLSSGCPTLHLRIRILNSLLRSQFWVCDKSNNLFVDKSSRKLSEIVEQAKRREKVPSHSLYRDSELIQENYLGAQNVLAEDVHVDEFTLLDRMLYKAPSDG